METKIKIIGELEKEHGGIHLRAIARAVNSGLPNVKIFLEILEKERVVIKEKEANLVKFRLRNGQKTLVYMKELNTEKLLQLPVKIQDSVNEFLGELEEKPLMALIFGSYAKNNYNKNSGVDILLVFQKLINEKDIENVAKKISMRTNTKINPVYVEYGGFEKNFLDKNHDFSREIRQEVIIVLGIENYYPLLWRFLE